MAPLPSRLVGRTRRPALPPACPGPRRGEPPPQSLAEALADLVGRLRRLTPDWQNPERFHEAKSELVAELLRLAQAPLVLPPPRLRFLPGPERVIERVVYVPVRPKRRPKPQTDCQLAFEFMD